MKNKWRIILQYSVYSFVFFQLQRKLLNFLIQILLESITKIYNKL